MKENLAKDRGAFTLVKKGLFSLLCLLLLFIVGRIPVPGVNTLLIDNLSASDTLMMLSMFSGGNLRSFSVLSVGLSPYITAQIIIQLLQSNVSSTITYWGKSGNVGRNKLTLLSRILTVLFGILQSLSVIYGINVVSFNHFLAINNFFTYLLLLSLLLSGTFFEMWLADRITEKGLGNGIAIIIAANIVGQAVSHFPLRNGFKSSQTLILILIIGVVFYLVMFFNESEEKLYIQYSRREYFAGQNNYIPIKLLIPNVMPVIFASTVMAIPQTVLLFYAMHSGTTWYRSLAYYSSLSSGPGMFTYGCLIFGFTYLYSFIQIEPQKLAESLQRQEAYIPGIAPGKETEQFITDLLLNMALPGALFLLTISIGPMLIHYPALNIGGTGVLIVAGVLSEAIRQARGVLGQTTFKPFIISGKER